MSFPDIARCTFAATLTFLIGFGIVRLPEAFVHRHFPDAEAKTQLKSALVAEKAYFGRFERYDESVEVIRFWPETGTRYRYLLSRGGPSRSPHDASDGGLHTGYLADELRLPKPDNDRLLAAIPPELFETIGVTGVCPACEITIVAVGNIDSDPVVDVWSISTTERTINGKLLPRGVPIHHVADDPERQ